MKSPTPHPGLVISYSYLWERDHRHGREDGTKDRPCAIIIARRIAAGKTIIAVLPITHSSPSDPTAAIEISPVLKRHLGLDDQRSWIILTEYNEFIWPGPDVRPVSGKGRGYAYGVLPPAFFNQIRERLLALIAERRVRPIRRTE